MMVRLIYEPSVYLVGATASLIHAGRLPSDGGVVEFLSDGGHSEAWWKTVPDDGDPEPIEPSCGEAIAELAGRLCYQSYNNPRPGGTPAYISHILEVGHGSVLEHAVYNFVFTGVSRSLTHELVRHRAGFGFSELSQRYCDMSETAFVVPPHLVDVVHAGEKYVTSRNFRGKRTAIRLARMYVGRHCGKDSLEAAGVEFIYSCGTAAQIYEDLVARLAAGGLDRKAARGAARAVLPECVETQICVTGNARAWRNFIDQRASRAADAEIRRLAVRVLEVLRCHSPYIFGDYMIQDGTASSPHRKV